MKSNSRFKSHNTHYNNKDYSLDEIREEFFGEEIMKKGMVATDVDGTMFENDLGVLAFLHKLKSPHSWSMRPNEFKEILTPDVHTAVVNLGLRGRIPDLDPKDCQLFFDLRDDVIELYGSIFTHPDPNRDLTINDPVVNEFARKMLEIDRLVLNMETVFQDATAGQLLMRTRFLKGMTIRGIRQIIVKMMEDHNNGGRYERLGIHDENQTVSKQKVTRDRLVDIDFDKRIKVVDDVHHVLLGLFDDGEGLPIRMVTTNLKDIAMGVLAGTVYSPLLDQKCDGKRPILASTLECDEFGVHGSEPDKAPVFGPTKKKILRELQTKMRKRVVCALGDSVNNDTPMMELSLENGGIAIIKGDEYPDTRERFKPFVDNQRRELGDADIGKRVFYVTENGA